MNDIELCAACWPIRLKRIICFMNSYADLLLYSKYFEVTKRLMVRHFVKLTSNSSKSVIIVISSRVVKNSERRSKPNSSVSFSQGVVCKSSGEIVKYQHEETMKRLTIEFFSCIDIFFSLFNPTWLIWLFRPISSMIASRSFSFT